LARVVSVLLTVLLAAYAGTYLAWSRYPSWNHGPLWSFYPPPESPASADLLDRYRAAGRSADEGWRRWEELPERLFRPCIWLDERLTGRTYLPTDLAGLISSGDW
jgi:hypothetical protein